MESKINTLIADVTTAAANPNFVHHKWFAKWHLEVVAKIADELCDHYPAADRTFVRVMAWMHDYGKIIDFDRQYEMTRVAGKPKLLDLGFDESYAEKVISSIETMDKKLELDIRRQTIEIQIVSTADGCSHLAGPFMEFWMYENPDKPLEELLVGNVRKAKKDWDHKIVLPEARQAFQAIYDVIILQNTEPPETFL